MNVRVWADVKPLWGGPATGPEEQLSRFGERERTEYKSYKLTPEGRRNRDKWLAYEASACDMIERTSSEITRRNLVRAEDEPHARIQVLEVLTRGLERVLGSDELQGKKSKR